MVVHKGRGATRNPDNRYSATRVEAVDDGWFDEFADATMVPRRPETVVLPDRTVNLITSNRSPDIPFTNSINAYKGCEHGCIYCFARPTHAYLDLSPGLDFETRLFYKTNIEENLEKQLGKRSYQCTPIAMGTNTDPYQPIEKQHRITRRILEYMLEHRHPVSIVTKGQLVLRDLDVLGELASHNLVSVNISLTSLDARLKTTLEPRTASPQFRLKAIRQLREAGVPTGAMLAPMIPFVNDSELEQLVAAAVEAGAQRLSYILVRLPLEVAPLFEAWLNDHLPLKAERVMSAIRATREGSVYKARWGERMTGTGAIAQLIGKRFTAALKKHGLADVAPLELRTDLFRRPGHRQMSLF